MKKLIAYSVIGAAVAASTNVLATEDHWYLGGSAASYYLDSERDLAGGDLESIAAGIQAGYTFGNDMAVELGHQADVGGDDLDATTLSLIKMLGEDDGFRPYLTTGLSHFNTDGATLEDDSTEQLHLGVGLSNMLSDNWEMRGDVRGFYELSGDNYVDAAVTLAVNYHFAKAAPAPVVEPAPAPAPEPVAEPETRTITVRLNVEFETDKDIVRAIYGDELEAVANAMKAHEDIELVLEGHTDSRGAESYNQNLSERRAAAVKAKLSTDYGIPAARISSAGYGESRPIDSNDTTEGRARNRRVIGEMSYSEVAE